MPPEVFVNQFLDSQAVVNKLKEEFKKRIRVEVLVKDLLETKAFYTNVNTIVQYLDHKYDMSSLFSIVNKKLEC